MKRLLLAAVLLMSVTVCAADEYIWIIGGGPVLQESQGQIELNVKWVREVLGRRAAKARVKVFYTDDRDPASDVVVRSDDAQDPPMQPLARVFGQHLQNRDRYHNNTVVGVSGGTDKEQLVAALKEDFAKLRPGDKVLIVYNGHGSVDRSNTLKNALRLWQEERLDVPGFEVLLSGISSGVTVRYFFTQCYSGAFAQAMYRGADAGGLPVAGRCGFLAEDKYRQAEGCSASINTRDYRDYTTSFFAVLDGHTRNGQALAGNADVDGDGEITLNDAHLYTLKYSRSADIPRSTSEVFLEQWQPWYLRLVADAGRPENIYSDIADALASELDLSLQEAGAVTSVLDKVKGLRGDINQYWVRINDLRKKLDDRQERIAGDVKRKWPQTLYPYTAKYAEFLRTGLPAALQYVLHHPLYDELVSHQDEEQRLLQEVLERERALTHYEKVLRMRKLARILEQFERYAGEEQKQAYKELLSCEKSLL